MGKGQSTVEFLIILAAFFAFLALWVPVVNGVRQGSAESMEQKYAELALSDLVGAGDEVYVLGNGNSRELNLRLLGNATVKFDPEARNASISILNGNRKLWREMRFNATNEELELDEGVNRVRVSYADGRVKFERHSSD